MWRGSWLAQRRGWCGWRDAVAAPRGRVRSGFLGIATQAAALTADLVQATGQQAALLVVSAQADAPAFRAGLRLGDALLAADDTPLRYPGELVPFLDEDRIGRPMRLRCSGAGSPAR